MLRGWLSRACAGFAAASTFAFVGASTALAVAGQPVDRQMGMQDPVTEVARKINEFHDFTNIIIVAIALFVLALMIYVLWRFNEKANPVPSKTTHNTFLEVAWTVVPIVILVLISVPSFKLLNLQYNYPKPDVTIKAIGYQWRWEHQYPDFGEVSVDSSMLTEEEVAEKNKATGLSYPYRLAVDNEVIVPVNKNVHVLVTAEDVIHNWTIPSFGSKVDAVPGRVTTTWFRAEKEGIYYGQCSELCGKDHAFMPIAVRVVSDQVFNDWVAAKKADDDDKADEIIRNVALLQAGLKSVADAGNAVKPASKQE